MQFNYTLEDDAVPLQKGTVYSVGYDLVCIREIKRTGNTIFYDTGVKVHCPNGMYVEIVPRSSMAKSGYMLANSIGIIDPDYTGNLIVALIKVDNSKEDLKLPFCLTQLVPRQLFECSFELVNDDLDRSTERGSGGFGSTNK